MPAAVWIGITLLALVPSVWTLGFGGDRRVEGSPGLQRLLGFDGHEPGRGTIRLFAWIGLAFGLGLLLWGLADPANRSAFFAFMLGL